VANFRNISIFSDNLKKIEFPGKNWSFTATSGQIILFLFKSHHFRTYVLFMIRYNTSQPVHDPPATPHNPPAQNLGVATPNPPGLTPLRESMIERNRQTVRQTDSETDRVRESEWEHACDIQNRDSANIIDLCWNIYRDSYFTECIKALLLITLDSWEIHIQSFCYLGVIHHLEFQIIVIHLISSYLTNHSQQVAVNSSCPVLVTCCSGVLQGSVFGYLLFPVFM